MSGSVGQKRASLAGQKRPGSPLRLARSPKRTCIGCRQVADKGELVRLVVSGRRVMFDLTSTLPGRGAYVHRAIGCIESAARGGLNRSFRRGFSADVVTAFREAGSALLETGATTREIQT